MFQIRTVVGLFIATFALSTPPLTAHAKDSESTAIYNEGVRLFEGKEFAAAAEKFERSSLSIDSKLASQSRFNQGNTHYARALLAIEAMKQPNAGDDVTQNDFETSRVDAVGHLESAIQCYRGALRLNGTDDDSRANIELASVLLNQLQPPEPQDQPQQDPESNQPSNERSGDESPLEPESQDPETGNSGDSEQDPNENRQQSDSESTEPPDPSSESGNDQGESDQERSDSADGSEESTDDSKESTQSTDSDNSNAEQGEPDSDPTDPGAGSNDQSSNVQDSSSDGSNQSPPSTNPSEEPGKTQPRGSRDEQTPPDTQDGAAEPTSDQNATDTEQTSGAAPKGELTAANESESDPGQVGNRVMQQPTEDRMSEEEARKLLQAIRDRDMIRRLRKQARLRERRVRVEKDW